MPQISFDLIDGDGYERTLELPAQWEICASCRGSGQSSGYLGAITSDEWHRDWSHDEQDEYVRGGYDRDCPSCNATGKVLHVDREACKTPGFRAILGAYDEQSRELAECDAIHRAEIARGA